MHHVTVQLEYICSYSFREVFYILGWSKHIMVTVWCSFRIQMNGYITENLMYCYTWPLLFYERRIALLSTANLIIQNHWVQFTYHKWTTSPGLQCTVYYGHLGVSRCPNSDYEGVLIKVSLCRDTMGPKQSVEIVLMSSLSSILINKCHYTIGHTDLPDIRRLITNIMTLRNNCWVSLMIGSSHLCNCSSNQSGIT